MDAVIESYIQRREAEQALQRMRNEILDIPSEIQGLERKMEEFSQSPFLANRKIKKKVRKLTKKYKTQRELAEALLEAVSKRVEYGKSFFISHKYEDAAGVYKRREGVCLDMAVLYTTMAREAGLDSGCVQVGKKHACSYVVVEGRKVLVDPTVGKKGFDVCYDDVQGLSDERTKKSIKTSNKIHRKITRASLLLAATLGAMCYIYATDPVERGKIDSGYAHVKSEIADVKNDISSYLKRY